MASASAADGGGGSGGVLLYALDVDVQQGEAVRQLAPFVLYVLDQTGQMLGEEEDDDDDDEDEDASDDNSNAARPEDIDRALAEYGATGTIASTIAPHVLLPPASHDDAAASSRLPLLPRGRVAAERQLDHWECTQPLLYPTFVHIVLSPQHGLALRLSAALALKHRLHTLLERTRPSASSPSPSSPSSSPSSDWQRCKETCKAQLLYSAAQAPLDTLRPTSPLTATLALALAKLARAEWPHAFPALFPMLFTLLDHAASAAASATLATPTTSAPHPIDARIEQRVLLMYKKVLCALASVRSIHSSAAPHIHAVSLELIPRMLARWTTCTIAFTRSLKSVITQLNTLSRAQSDALTTSIELSIAYLRCLRPLLVFSFARLNLDSTSPLPSSFSSSTSPALLAHPLTLLLGSLTQSLSIVARIPLAHPLYEHVNRLIRKVVKTLTQVELHHPDAFRAFIPSTFDLFTRILFACHAPNDAVATMAATTPSGVRSPIAVLSSHGSREWFQESIIVSALSFLNALLTSRDAATQELIRPLFDDSFVQHLTALVVRSFMTLTSSEIAEAAHHPEQFFLAEAHDDLDGEGDLFGEENETENENENEDDGGHGTLGAPEDGADRIHAGARRGRGDADGDNDDDRGDAGGIGTGAHVRTAAASVLQSLLLRHRAVVVPLLLRILIEQTSTAAAAAAATADPASARPGSPAYDAALLKEAALYAASACIDKVNDAFVAAQLSLAAWCEQMLLPDLQRVPTQPTLTAHAIVQQRTFAFLAAASWHLPATMRPALYACLAAWIAPSEAATASPSASVSTNPKGNNTNSGTTTITPPLILQLEAVRTLSDLLEHDFASSSASFAPLFPRFLVGLHRLCARAEELETKRFVMGVVQSIIETNGDACLPWIDALLQSFTELWQQCTEYNVLRQDLLALLAAVVRVTRASSVHLHPFLDAVLWYCLSRTCVNAAPVLGAQQQQLAAQGASVSASTSASSRQARRSASAATDGDGNERDLSFAAADALSLWHTIVQHAPAPSPLLDALFDEQWSRLLACEPDEHGSKLCSIAHSYVLLGGRTFVQARGATLAAVLPAFVLRTMGVPAALHPHGANASHLSLATLAHAHVRPPMHSSAIEALSSADALVYALVCLFPSEFPDAALMTPILHALLYDVTVVCAQLRNAASSSSTLSSSSTVSSSMETQHAAVMRSRVVAAHAPIFARLFVRRLDVMLAFVQHSVASDDGNVVDAVLRDLVDCWTSMRMLRALSPAQRRTCVTAALMCMDARAGSAPIRAMLAPLVHVASCCAAEEREAAQQQQQQQAPRAWFLAEPARVVGLRLAIDEYSAEVQRYVGVDQGACGTADAAGAAADASASCWWLDERQQLVALVRDRVLAWCNGNVHACGLDQATLATLFA